MTKELYQLNTSVLLTIRAAIISSSNVVYSLPLNVCYHEGDTIGIQLPSNSLLRIATDNSSLIYKREVPAQCSDVVSEIFQPSNSYTGSPQITIVTAQAPSLASSTPPSTETMVLSSMSQNVIIIPVAASVGGVALLLLLLITVLIGLTACRRTRMRDVHDYLRELELRAGPIKISFQNVGAICPPPPPPPPPWRILAANR